MLMETNEPYNIDVAPLLRGDVQFIRIPVYGSPDINTIELAVVKTAVLNKGSFFVGTLNGVSCRACNRKYPKSTEPFNFCPGCGAKIVEA